VISLSDSERTLKNELFGVCVCVCVQTHDNREHLAMMERVLGTLPYRIAKKSK